jgi:hypothetical protein
MIWLRPETGSDAGPASLGWRHPYTANVKCITAVVIFSGAGIFTPASGRAIDPAEYQGSMRHQQAVLDHLFDRQLIRP